MFTSHPCTSSHLLPSLLIYSSVILSYPSHFRSYHIFFPRITSDHHIYIRTRASPTYPITPPSPPCVSISPSHMLSLFVFMCRGTCNFPSICLLMLMVTILTFTDPVIHVAPHLLYSHYFVYHTPFCDHTAIQQPPMITRACTMYDIGARICGMCLMCVHYQLTLFALSGAP
jgi:hypothetical protein